jgi:hypothetical protein
LRCHAGCARDDQRESDSVMDHNADYENGGIGSERDPV